MNKIILASRNPGKIIEIGLLFKETGITMGAAVDYPDLPEVVENGTTFLENALKKARTLSEQTGEITLADDSGLEVEALDGAPGVYSARYAGDDANDEKNIRKLLEDLKGIATDKRNAVFRCVLVLYRPDGTYNAFDGRWEGRIAEERAGNGGFGYDPIFFLPDRQVTVAELEPGLKNRISHRANAFQKLRIHLKHNQNGA